MAGRPERRRRFRLAREGWLFSMVTIGVGAAAINTGNNLLYLVLGLMLSLIILSGVLSDLVLIRIAPSRHLPPRAHAESPFLVELVLENQKAWLPTYSIEIEDVAAGEPSDRRCYFLKVDAGKSERAVYRRTLPRRGLWRFSGMVLRTRYPFGLLDKSLVVAEPGELVVYPALVPDPERLATELDRGAPTSTLRAGHGVEPLGVREHRTGDEARTIHARRSAALGTLIVRETSRETTSALVVEVDDVTTGDPESDDAKAALELSISKAAWLVVEAASRGRGVTLVTKGGVRRDVAPGAPVEPILAFLALLPAVPRKLELRSAA